MTAIPPNRPPAVPADRGLQAERTALSWWRTAVGAMANALLFLHVALTSGDRAATVLALVAIGALAVITTVCVARSRSLHTHAWGRWSDGRVAMSMTSAAICVVASAALVVALLESTPGWHL
ncbi:DUF202 domain-containing protein [Nocardia sp. BSTN01]|uniref:DUF202 domain-containing protein n=1 Tax=Nocardia sp. BSTN01 TaxID=2783665 RepID=UPI00188E2294|nr:DUF202 domain-containing protein [Nocardia sp. BSTN01]MBF5002143.1 DUF202 domain-containing protein [Nocardia sp. BSTN01]